MVVVVVVVVVVRLARTVTRALVLVRVLRGRTCRQPPCPAWLLRAGWRREHQPGLPWVQHNNNNNNNSSSSSNSRNNNMSNSGNSNNLVQSRHGRFKLLPTPCWHLCGGCGTHNTPAPFELRYARGFNVPG